MSKGIWPAVSGSIAQNQRLDTVANNLANVNTDGFKKDSVTFKKVMSDATKANAEEDIPRRMYTDKDFYRLDGRDKAFVKVDASHTDFKQGSVKITHNPLDVAIEGKGFLEVLTPQGVRFTRRGSMSLDGEGNLVTGEGYRVLSRGAAPDPNNPTVPSREELLGRSIQLNGQKAGELRIVESGKIFKGKEEIAELSVAEFVDTRLLVKEGNSLFRNDIAANLQPEAGQSKLRQGMIETSNVNAVSELVELLKASRLFEANQKIVRSYGDMEAKAVAELGKL